MLYIYIGTLILKRLTFMGCEFWRSRLSDRFTFYTDDSMTLYDDFFKVESKLIPCESKQGRKLDRKKEKGEKIETVFMLNDKGALMFKEFVDKFKLKKFAFVLKADDWGDIELPEDFKESGKKYISCNQISNKLVLDDRIMYIIK